MAKPDSKTNKLIKEPPKGESWQNHLKHEWQIDQTEAVKIGDTKKT